MNLKLLLPTFRTRHRFVAEALARITKGVPVERMLNLGSGEGDYDRSLLPFCHELCACDINADDVAHARGLNAGLPRIRYAVEDAQALTYPDAHFDVVTCLEVLEHVAEPRRVLSEIARVLRDGGSAVLTVPSERFPVTYDPINAALRPLGKHIGFGAYGYGHKWLVSERTLDGWLADVDLRIEERHRLSGPLASSLECYWPGAMQKLLKANAGNTDGSTRTLLSLRPSSNEEPPFAEIVDRIIDADRALFSKSRSSVGLAYVVAKSPGA